MRALIARLPDGTIELRSWPPWAARVFDEVVELASPDLPPGAARDRLLQPGVTDDPADVAEWRLRAHPELIALFASSRAVVAADLATAERTTRGGIRRVAIPPGHVAAWIATLNAARLRLGAEHDVDADAMQAEIEDLRPEQQAAVARINLLGLIQEHLVAAVEG